MRNALLALLAIATAYAAPPESAPLFFAENRGQLPDTVRYMAQGSGMVAYFSPSAIHFREAAASLRMQFVGGNPDVRVEGVTGFLP